jgi:hypothetical protein
MMGDIHKRQSFNHKGTVVAYYGSLSNKILVKSWWAWIFIYRILSQRPTEHDVDNRHPYYQFKLKSDDLDNGTEETNK